MKSLILTHKDVDGIASAAIIFRYLQLKVGLSKEEINIIFTGPSNLPKELDKVVNLSNIRLYISDISMNISSAGEIKGKLKKIREKGNEIYWIDHHEWRNEDVKDINQIVNLLMINKSTSAARIAYEKLMFDDEISRKICMYADDIDTLTDKFNESFVIRALSFRDKWRKKLFEKFIKGIFWDDEIASETKNIWKKTEKDLAKTLNKTKIYNTKNGLRFGFIDLRGVKTPKSWLAKKIAEKNNLDFTIVWRSNNSISAYIGDKSKNINLLKIAEKFGGGGHVFACGFRVKISLKSKIMNSLSFKKLIPNEIKKVIETIIEIM
ncbi:MAG: DHH family phosphoesterase [Candidatus Methanomethylicia archaeon]|nr:DHH family phosphoesterase [Candidatus Methanomethylicia archaeon]